MLKLKEGELFELERPLYVICDAGDYGGETIETHLINELNMKSTGGDSAMFKTKRVSTFLD